MGNKNKKKRKANISPKVLGWEALIFTITLGMGIVSAYRLNKLINIERRTFSTVEFWKFGLYFIGLTLFLVFFSSVSKFQEGKSILFKLFFLFAVSLGALSLLGVWLPSELVLPLLIILIIAWMWKPLIIVHDLLVIMGIAGAGSLLGLSFIPELVILLLIIFSIYDFVAVYKTRHMVKMAKEMLRSGAIVGIVIPESLRGFKEDVNEVTPGEEFMILGGGDIIFPLVLCASLIPESLVGALIVAVFSLLGVLSSYWIFTSQRIRKPIPALPPIALLSFIGFLVVRFLL